MEFGLEDAAVDESGPGSGVGKALSFCWTLEYNNKGCIGLSYQDSCFFISRQAAYIRC